MSVNQFSASVAVVGGGIIGLSIARELARRGLSDVCLIERAKLGSEASFAAAGMLLPQVEADAPDDFFSLACRSRDLYRAFAGALHDETGIDVELDDTGTLYLAFTEHDLEDCWRRYEWQTQAGLVVELLKAQATRELEPCVSSSLAGALFFPNDIQVDNRRLVNALVNSVNDLSVKILTGTNVESLNIEGNRITGVRTGNGLVTCDAAVIAAGTWASDLLRASACPDPMLQPVRGQIVCLEAKPQLTRHVLYSPRGYLVPRRDGRLLAGSTSENAGFAKSVTAGGIGSIMRNALEISPDVSALPVIDSWAGLRPRAADGLPVLGPCGEIDGLFYATGHYRNGILLAPLTAELISEAILDRVVSPLLAPFSPDRFSAQPVLR